MKKIKVFSMAVLFINLIIIIFLIWFFYPPKENLKLFGARWINGLYKLDKSIDKIDIGPKTVISDCGVYKHINYVFPKNNLTNVKDIIGKSFYKWDLVYDDTTTDSLILIYKYDMFISENYIIVDHEGFVEWNGIIKPHHQSVIDIGELIKSEYNIDLGLTPNYEKIRHESKP